MNRFLARLLLFFFVVSTINVHSQTNSRPDSIGSKFPGGDDGWQKFLSKNFKYPDEAISNEVQGDVIVEFTVDTSGTPTNVKVISGPAVLRKECINMISVSKWIPAEVGGKKVESTRRQPFHFRLQKP
ncbi:MAG TPA: energy transducer TonB [Puia sp.]|nr:energy transducer TonB [Puia sp.]